MEVKIERKDVVLETTDATFPIYAYVEQELEYGERVDYFVKLDEHMFTQIKISSISTEITKFKTNNYVIPATWWDNQCEKEVWDEQLKHTHKTFYPIFN